MTVKEFFKSTAFKCIVTLTCILLVCGIFLTVSYGFLEVTAEDRLQRAINKIYGEEVKVEVIDADFSDDTSTVLEAYADERGGYLIKAKGKGGFGGTVTCWVLIDVENGEIKKVNKVTIETSDGETFLGNINYLDKFAATEYTEGYLYTTDDGFLTAGASKSSTAINNCVNGAVKFVNSVLGGER